MSFPRTSLLAALLGLAAMVAPAAAQPAPPAGPLTLEQALELAEAHSDAIGIAQAGVQRAVGEAIRARSGRYPQLAAAATYDRALASEFEGVFDDAGFGGGDTNGEPFDDLPFGRENTWRVSLSFSQTLYAGGRLRAQANVAEVGREAAGLAVTTARAQVLFDVTQAYYDAALGDRLVAIAEASLSQAAATLVQTQAGFDAGMQPEFDVLRARVARDSQTPALIRQRVNRDVAMLRLKQLLDLPQEYDLQLADALGDDVLAPPAVFAARLAPIEAQLEPPAFVPVVDAGRGAVPVRTAVSEAETAVRVREAALALAEAQRMPSLSLQSTYSRIAYPTGFLPAFDRTNWSLGASVNVPILTGGRQRGDEQVARAEVEQARLQLRQVEDLAALDTRSAWAELQAARAVWQSTAGTVQQAARAYEIADVRYRAGVSTQLEISDARLLLQQAETNRAQAARDLQVARARVALLQDLPLGAGGAVPAPRQPMPRPFVPEAPAAGGDVVRASAQGGSAAVGLR